MTKTDAVSIIIDNFTVDVLDTLDKIIVNNNLANGDENENVRKTSNKLLIELKSVKDKYKNQLNQIL